MGWEQKKIYTLHESDKLPQEVFDDVQRLKRKTLFAHHRGKRKNEKPSKLVRPL